MAEKVEDSGGLAQGARGGGVLSGGAGCTMFNHSFTFITKTLYISVCGERVINCNLHVRFQEQEQEEAEPQLQEHEPREV